MEKMSLPYSPTENLTPEASFTVNITTSGELHGHGSGWGAMAVAWPAASEESRAVASLDHLRSASSEARRPRGAGTAALSEGQQHRGATTAIK